MSKDLRGSGSKKNVGRKALDYETKILYKTVPKEVYDLCFAFVDSEVIKWKEKNNK